MKTKRTIQTLLATFALIAIAYLLALRGFPPSKVKSVEERKNLENGIGSSLSDTDIYQLHKGWTDSTSYYRMKTTEQEYTSILNAGHWESSSRDETAGFGKRPFWWRVPVESADWKYHKRASPYGTGGFEVLIRNPETRLTYFMTFSE